MNVAAEVEIEINVLGPDSDEEESNSDSEVEVIASEKVEEAVGEPYLITTKSLVALLKTLEGSDGNPLSAPTSEAQNEVEAVTNDAEQASSKKQITDTAPDPDFSSPVSNPKPTMSNNPNPAAATQETINKHKRSRF
ncbi:hypothetical protein Hanom_Chr04g00351671 [Helianthus anomalus]